MNRATSRSSSFFGLIYYKENRVETATEHQPVYLRVSQAERERAERERAERKGRTRKDIRKDKWEGKAK